MSNDTELLLEELRAIRVMMESVLKSSNDLQWIEGYAIGATETDTAEGKPGVYVLLYAKGEYMSTPTVKVYKSQSYPLPVFIKDAVEWDNSERYRTITGKGADKKSVKKKGYFVEVPGFQIARSSGKETDIGNREKFLSGVVSWSKEAKLAEREAKKNSGGAVQAPAKTTSAASGNKLGNSREVVWAVEYGAFPDISTAAQKYGELMVLANEQKVGDLSTVWRKRCMVKYAEDREVYDEKTASSKLAELSRDKGLTDLGWQMHCHVAWGANEIAVPVDEVKAAYLELRRMINPNTDREMWDSWKSKVSKMAEEKAA